MYYQSMRGHLFSPLRVITVRGDGEVFVKPNYAQIQIEVSTEGKDVRGAQQENANIMNQVIQSLLQLNIPREDIQTAAFNVLPQYDYVEGKQIFRGYEVTNALTVKVRDTSKIGSVIDSAIQNGANRVSGIQFKIENADPYYQQALRLALQNAQTKAKTIAETLKLTLHPQPIEVVEERETGPILYKSVAMADQTFSTPIEPGQILINAIVKVKYQY
ncbi:SIMPL domain-containing protein [Bacillus sp. Cr_A10]|uniref:SIMPL domain-containing protein n=1 Tax=Bacillus sp. Cr_A10 TaxID=3033993 RepID=UPI0023DAD5A6|nr:SIMPL domain-containing protein [Bacillus sp. Cr_A10]MDF2067771.1 SIMPL domain-containing protein [Bacillus sp. Cr_A10]